MNFGLLLPHLSQLQQLQQMQQMQHTLHPDVLGARERASVPPPCRKSRLAARWRDLRARVFRV